MAAISRLLELLFWVVIAGWALKRLWSWLVHPPLRGQPRRVSSSAPRPVGRLHRDPCCGTFVAEEIAWPLVEAGRTLYFCSEQCRSRYQARQQQAHTA
jgi:YHS domain-containing protein